MSETTEVQIIDPKEFGLEPKNVESIESAFAPKIAEREGLVKIYEPLLTREITPQLVHEAKELRLKLVKVRTGISTVHKSQKEFFLSAGRFVDAWKNKETLPVAQMEEKLKSIEDHYAKIERERLDKLQSDRSQELGAYVNDANERDLSGMEEDVWKAFLETKRKDYEDMLNLQKKEREEKEAKIKAEKEEQERIRKENEELKKAAELKAKKDEEERLERERIAKVESDARAKVETKRIANEKKEREEREEKAAKERKAQEEKLNAERLERERVQKELDDKKEEEKKRADFLAEEERKKEEKAKLAELAPDRQKIINWLDDCHLFINPNVGGKAHKTVCDIQQKFTDFKVWAKNQVDQIK